MNRITVSANVLSRARERAGLTRAELREKFPHLAEWEAEKTKPTMKQSEKFASTVRVPFGFLFLPEPPKTRMPFTDFRTLANRRPQGISPELMDTIQIMQRRQSWLRDERIEVESEPITFVGSANLQDDPLAIGQEMRRIVGLDHSWAKKVKTWIEAVGKLREAIEDLGVMAIINGVVGNNTKRKLDVAEFRGFALSDPYAPLIFINGSDTKSAQMFTLAHGLAHLWLGADGEGLSGFQNLHPDGNQVEEFCNKAASEFLVPSLEIENAWSAVAHSETPFEKLARQFKVSPVVIGRRAMDLRLVGPQEFFSFHKNYTQQERFKKRQRIMGGGDFYNNQNTRVGKLFASQLIRAAKEGRVGFKEAYSLLHEHAKGNVHSIDRVRKEVLIGHKDNDLVRWVNAAVPKSFFVESDIDDVVERFKQITPWIARHSRYQDEAKANFASGVDGWLVAHAMDTGKVLVTNKQSGSDSRNKVKLPNVCDVFSVNYEDTFSMLQKLEVKYNLLESI